MTRLEKILIALVAAWIVQAASGPLLHSMMVKMMAANMTTDKKGMPDASATYYMASSIVGFLVKVVYGYWLYMAAKFEKEKKWLWCLVGFFGGIYGVLIFYPYLILRELRAKTEPNKAPLPTPASVTQAASAPVAPPSGAADR